MRRRQILTKYVKRTHTGGTFAKRTWPLGEGRERLIPVRRQAESGRSSDQTDFQASPLVLAPSRDLPCPPPLLPPRPWGPSEGVTRAMEPWLLQPGPLHAQKEKQNPSRSVGGPETVRCCRVDFCLFVLSIFLPIESLQTKSCPRLPLALRKK